jgi:N-acetylglucosaminyl-diphospho-decaprenol L-rhamnosyltransferase
VDTLAGQGESRRRPGVGVVILRLGAGEINVELRAAVASLRQSEQVDLVGVVVVENGSLGDTPTEPEVDRILRFSENLGYSAAMNAGAKDLGGDMLLVLTADARPAPNALDLLVRALSDESVGVAGPVLYVGNERWFGGSWNRRLGWARHHHVEQGNPDWLDGACLCIRRADFDRLGGFNPSFFLYAEDVLLCRQLAAEGKRVVLVPEAHVSQSSGMFSRSGAHAFLIARNEIAVVRTLEGSLISMVCAGICLIRAGLELSRGLRFQRLHHLKQCVGFVAGAVYGIAHQSGPPPRLLARWGGIPLGPRSPSATQLENRHN